MENLFTTEYPTISMVLGAILITFETGTFNMLTYGHWGLGYPTYVQSTLKLDGNLERKK